MALPQPLRRGMIGTRGVNYLYVACIAHLAAAATLCRLRSRPQPSSWLLVCRFMQGCCGIDLLLLPTLFVLPATAVNQVLLPCAVSAAAENATAFQHRPCMQGVTVVILSWCSGTDRITNKALSDSQWPTGKFNVQLHFQQLACEQAQQAHNCSQTCR